MASVIGAGRCLAEACWRWLCRWQNWLVGVAILAAILVGCRLWPHPPLRAAFPHSTAVYDDAGHLLRLTLASDGQYRLWVPYQQLSPILVQAVLMHEDQWFWWHPGFNPWGLVRGAWVTYVLGHHPQGGSTITMQLARLVYHLHTRSPLGKLYQIAQAVKLELFYSKKQILTAYLNYAPYGGNVVGAATASRIYFHKPVRDLNLPEALTLAVLPQNPSRRLTVSHASGKTIEARGLRRARDRLYHVWRNVHPGAQRWQAVFDMPLVLRNTSQLPFAAPHAVDQLLGHARQNHVLLPQRVNLTIDQKLQNLVVNQLKNYVRHKEDIGIHNAAALLVDTRTMGIKAMVGSADFFSRAISGQINGTLAERSPGSTLKPFIYGLAIDQGVLIPATVLRDVPTSFGAYTPENFDGQFMGPVTATQALVRSRNVPAVWVDSQLENPDLYGFLQAAGLHNLASRQHYGLSLVLGGGDVTMQDLARMYAIFPNQGMLRPLRLRKDAPQVHGKRLLSRAASFMIIDMLKQNPRPGAVAGAQPASLPAWWKTGTSWAFHDAWTAGGFGPYILVIWVGNFDSTPNSSFVGRQAAAPLFFRIYDAMRAAYPKLHVANKPLPPRIKRVPVCIATGKLPSKWCPEIGKSWFIPGVSPIQVGHIYRPVIINDATGLPACPPYEGKSTHVEVFQYWPSSLAAVFAAAGIPVRRPPNNTACVAAGIPGGEPPTLSSPLSGVAYVMRLGRKNGNTITLRANADASVSRLYWFANHAYIGHSKPGEALHWRPPQVGSYIIRVVDDHGRATQRELFVTRVE